MGTDEDLKDHRFYLKMRISIMIFLASAVAIAFYFTQNAVSSPETKIEGTKSE